MFNSHSGPCLNPVAMDPRGLEKSRIDPVKLDAIIPQNFPAAIRRHFLMEKFLGRFRKIGVAVRIVGGKDEVIVADQLADVADIGFVALAADHALALEILAGLHGQERRVMLAELLPVAVHALQP